jgi:hypothetical protein
MTAWPWARFYCAQGEGLEMISVAVSLNGVEEKGQDEVTDYPGVDVAALCSR